MKIATGGLGKCVYVLLGSIRIRAMRVYAAEVGRPVRDRPGWVQLTARQWRNRPGVNRDYHPALEAKDSLLAARR